MSWAGEDGEGMNKSLNEVESLDRLIKTDIQSRELFLRGYFWTEML